MVALDPFPAPHRGDVEAAHVPLRAVVLPVIGRLSGDLFEIPVERGHGLIANLIRHILHR